MRLFVYSVFDKAVNAYLQPFFCRSTGEAIRSFTEAVNDPNKQFGRYSTDYVLMQHGEWDDNSGMFQCGDPVRLLAASEVLLTGTDIVSPSVSAR
ncbi:MAG: nonstructural protein [Microvirus sp.]|nr:MAG: nonstructural protein [Microvirus sp.]